MRICMVMPGHDFPPDIRVEKEARTLTGAGHSLHVLCDNLRGRAAADRWEDIPVWRRRRLPMHVQLEKFNGVPGWMSLVDRGWRRYVEAFARSNRVDAFHVHDLPKSGAVIAAGRTLGIPVVLDLHENFPGSMGTYVDGMRVPRRWAGRLLIRPDRWAGYERKQVAAAARVISVVKEAAERLVREHATPAAKIAIVENTEALSSLRGFKAEPALVRSLSDRFVLLYIGGFGGMADHRGLTTAIEAMPAVCASIPDAHLILVGKGAIRKTLARLAGERGLVGKVSIIDWIPQNQVYSYVAASAVCLVPYRSTPNTEASSPNKLFQYMYMEKPVVVSSCRSLARYVSETGGGIVFRAGDSAGLAEAVLRLKDPSLRAEMGARGKAAVIAKYNWEASSAALLEAYAFLRSEASKGRKTAV